MTLEFGICQVFILSKGSLGFRKQHEMRRRNNDMGKIFCSFAVFREFFRSERFKLFNFAEIKFSWTGCRKVLSVHSMVVVSGFTARIRR